MPISPPITTTVSNTLQNIITLSGSEAAPVGDVGIDRSLIIENERLVTRSNGNGEQLQEAFRGFKISSSFDEKSVRFSIAVQNQTFHSFVQMPSTI